MFPGFAARRTFWPRIGNSFNATRGFKSPAGPVKGLDIPDPNLAGDGSCHPDDAVFLEEFQIMYREGHFRVWRPKPKCECGDHLDCHKSGMCQRPGCPCLKFRLKRWTRKEFARGQGAGGRKYDSGLEARVAADLNQQLACGELTEVKRPFPVDIIINGIKICRYYVDFQVVYNDGTKELIEVKGLWTETALIKKRLLEAVYLPANPGVKYRILR